MLVAPLLAMLPSVNAPALAAVAPNANPPIEDTCGVDLTVVLDASGSVSSSHAVDDVRNAAEALLESLSNTDSTARVTQFATVAEQLAPSTLITDGSLGTNGALRTAINRYYNPLPPRPSGVNIYEFQSGNPLSSGSYRSNNSGTQYTNWDGSLHQAKQTTPELVVYVTDGDPTAFDFDQAGDPFDPGPPPDVAMRTDRTSAAQQVTVDRAVQEANGIKSNGSRMLAIGVGSALSNPASQQRLVQISGPQVVRDADLANVDSLNEIDVALVTDFADLAAFMRAVTLQLCSPSLTVRKLAQSADSAAYDPAAGWDITVAPRVPGGNGFNWILPNTTPAVSKTLSTDSNGFAQFQWEPDPPEEDSAATVAEGLQPGYIPGRPDGTDYRCELRNEDGDVRVVEGEFANPANPTFDLNPIGQEIVTCSMYNSFDYQPAIALAKVNSPTEVRGDLAPPAVVTSTYTATNPGNTPLSNIKLTDDQCGLVTPIPAVGPNAGDTSPQNGSLDPGESWEFGCLREASASQGPPGGLNVVNTAEVQGNDPTGTVVTDTASDDVDIFVPGIDLVKLVNGVPSVTVVSGTPVTYTYAVSNTGNTPLGTPALQDDTPPCEDPTLSDDGNGDATLDIGETWTYTCTASPTSSVVNTATVSATPLNPLRANAPFTGNNPDVTDTDAATVNVTSPGLSLTKVVDQDVVFPGTEVTYTYTAANTGTADLRNDTGNPGWIADDQCSPVTPLVGGGGFNLGDDNADELLNPGESWQFECSANIDSLTINVATIVAQPVDGAGDPVGGALTRRALALVRVLDPAISLTKSALVGVVLDPDASPVSGPDVPTPREAEYIYDVANTGSTPISDVVITDDRCAALTFVDGDTNDDEVLDLDEVWHYTCSTALQRQQGTPPPQNESGLVTNTATVTGTPFLPDQPGTLGPEVRDTDTAQVLVIEPSLTLTKTASASAVLADSNVTYTITIENTGDVGLDVIGPSDDKCAPLDYTGGDVNNNGLLDGANSANPESWTYTCTRNIALPSAPDTADVNTASVSAIDPLGNIYEAEDTAQVRVIDPAINLEKTVSDTLVPAGSDVSYEFLVTNTGQSPIASDDVLGDIVLRDVSSPANPSCQEPVLIAKEGGNQDDLLDREPAEVWRYGCSGRVTDPTVDVAGVRGTGGSTIGEDVRVVSFAVAFVDVFHPSIEVEKTADPTLLVGEGGEVTYTYRVRNTGDVPLANVRERITDDTCSPVTYVRGDEDGDGLLDTPNSIFEDSLDETWVFTCKTNVDKTTTNTVVVEGTPVDPGGVPLCGSQNPDRSLAPCDVSARDRAVVRVTAPGTIVVTKETKPSSAETFKFTLRGKEFKLAGGDSKTFDELAPGSYRVTEMNEPGWDLESLKCKDPTGNTAVDRQDGSALIHLKAGETVKCTFTNVGQRRDGVLAPTGAPPWLGRLLALGALLVLAGGALIILRRRRSQTA